MSRVLSRHWKVAAMLGLVVLAIFACTSLSVAVVRARALQQYGDEILVQTGPSLHSAVQQEPTGAAPGEARVGEAMQVRVGDTEVTYRVVSTERPRTDADGEAATRGAFLSAEISVEVTGGGTYVSAEDWVLLTRAETVVYPTYRGLPDRPVFEGGRLTAGQAASGWLLFDVAPEALSGARLRLTVRTFTVQDQEILWVL